MKNYIIIFTFLLAAVLHGQHSADDLVGYYYSIDPFTGEGSQSYIYRTADGTYQGKVCWVQNKAKKKFIGLVFLKGLTYNASANKWENGILIYPGKKGTFKTYMKFSSRVDLTVRGYWGISLLGMTVNWKKESTQR